MRYVLSLIGILASAITVVSAAQSGARTPLRAEILITTLSEADLEAELNAPAGKIEHVSEVRRDVPAAAVLRVDGCQPNDKGDCTATVEMVVRRPDGSIHSETKKMDLPRGRGFVPLTFAADAPAGVYTVVATVSDLAARRFTKAERKFGLR